MNTGRIDEIYFEQEEEIHITEKPKLIHKISIATSPNIFGLVKFTIHDIENKNASMKVIGDIDLTDQEIMDIYHNTNSEYSNIFKYLYTKCINKNKKYKIFYDKNKIVEYENRQRNEYDFSQIEKLGKDFFDNIESQNDKLKKQNEKKELVEYKLKHRIKDTSVNVEINFGY